MKWRQICLILLQVEKLLFRLFNLNYIEEEADVQAQSILIPSIYEKYFWTYSLMFNRRQQLDCTHTAAKKWT